MYIHSLGEDRSLIIDVGHADADRGSACAGGCALIYSHHHTLIHVIGPFIIQLPTGADHTLSRNGKVRTLDEVGYLRIQPSVTVSG